ncbi:uracil-DNA glycosylase family protein [Paludibaculum fermentans]|uniref:uracil-DNA glycosylase family protein n=1 Tax=Paludibaculum fermentans TaxID=1473598 RepID=UPI003EBBFD0A
MRFEHVKALPFVGESYNKETPWGLPILILGEAHYTTIPLYPEITNEVVEGSVTPDRKWESWMMIFAKTPGIFHGGWTDPEQRRRFWSSMAFYNYVQESVGSEARTRPTEEMWKNAVPAFEEVVNHLQPRFILVLGNELWKNLPKTSKPGPPVSLSDGELRESRLYPNGAGDAFVFGIAHPSSIGWSYKKWTPWVQAALKAAIQFQKGGKAA